MLLLFLPYFIEYVGIAYDANWIELDRVLENGPQAVRNLSFLSITGDYREQESWPVLSPSASRPRCDFVRENVLRN